MILASFFIYIFWSDVTGATQVIVKSVQTATAGHNVTLHCQLAGKHDIVQMTWQKEQGKTKTNVATYSETHGSRVLGKYQNNVQLFQSGMAISAITFRTVTFKDDGCYDCIFNTFPLGSISGKTCLKVYALTEPKVTVKHIIDPEKAGKGVLEFSCSATGKPKPMITWKFKHLLIKPKQYVIQQLNETVTVVSNFTHIFSQVIWENPIICVIHHPSLNHTQELTVPMTVMEETPNKNPGMDITLTCVLIALILISLFIFYLWRLLPAEKKQGLLCCVLPVCPRIATDGKYGYTLQEVSVKSLPEGKLPDR